MLRISSDTGRDGIKEIRACSTDTDIDFCFSIFKDRSKIKVYLMCHSQDFMDGEASLEDLKQVSTWVQKAVATAENFDLYF
jgi:hypothetical protein